LREKGSQRETDTGPPVEQAGIVDHECIVEELYDTAIGSEEYLKLTAWAAKLAWRLGPELGKS
jgi:hypothetical protein